MDDVVCVIVPDELGQALTEEGFEEFEPVRGIDAVTFITVVCSAVGLPASLTIILGGKDDIAAFVKKVREWMTHRSCTSSGSEFVLDASCRRGDDHTRIRVVSRHHGTDQAPQVDMAALESLLRSIVADRDQLPAADDPGAVPPAV
jgi:hypothetical protein